MSIVNSRARWELENNQIRANIEKLVAEGRKLNRENQMSPITLAISAFAAGGVFAGGIAAIIAILLRH